MVFHQEHRPASLQGGATKLPEDTGDPGPGSLRGREVLDPVQRAEDTGQATKGSTLALDKILWATVPLQVTQTTFLKFLPSSEAGGGRSEPSISSPIHVLSILPSCDR